MVNNENMVSFARNYGADEFILKKTWETFEILPENSRAVEMVKNMDPFVTPGAYIHGVPGSGKSHMMKAVFTHYLKWKVECHEKGLFVSQRFFWINMSQYLQTLRGDADNTNKRRPFDATVLFMDDLGASTKSDWVVDQVFQLLDHRAEREMQTFITSNMNLEELGNFYTKRISSRILEMCVAIPMYGKDYRRTKLNEKNTATVLSRINKNNDKEKI